MSRNFNDDATDHVIIAAGLAQADMAATQAYSVLTFIRLENVDADRRTIWNMGGASGQGHGLRTDTATAPVALQSIQGGSAGAATSAVIELNTWYLAVETNDGADGATSLTVYVVSMAGVVLGSDTGDHTNAFGGTPAMYLARKQHNTADPFDGDLAHFAYFDFEMTQSQILEYAANPANFTARHKNSDTVYVPLNGSSPEVDLSGNGISGTVGGTPTITDMPPTSPLYGFNIPAMVFAAGGTEYTQSAAGTLTPAGALLRMTDKTFAGSITPAGALVRQGQKPVAGTVTPAGILLKKAIKSFAGAITPTGALSTTKLFVRAIAGSIAPAGALVRQTLKPLAGSITPAGALAKLTAKVFAGSITPTGALATVKTVLKSIAGAIAPSGALVRRTNKVLAGTLTPAGALVRLISKTLAGTLTPTGALSAVRLFYKSIAGTIAPSGTLATVLQEAGSQVGIVALTVKTRVVALTLQARATALTIKDRVIDLTLPSRGA